MKKSNIILISILTIIFLISGINFSQATSSSTNTIQTEKANNYLKSLSVEGYTLTPEFNKYTLNYYLVVPTSVSSLEVRLLKG